MTTPSFSIGIPTCNRPEFLLQALTSCLNQTVLPLEIVVVNDGGYANSSEVVRGLSSPLIRLYEIPHGGRPIARNRVLSEFRGDFLVWLDDDDALLPWCIETHIEMLREIPDTDVSYGNQVICDSMLRPCQVAIKRTVQPGNMLFQFFQSNPVPNPSTAISRRCIELVGPFDLRYLRAQDYDYYVRAARAGARFTHVNVPMCLYRSHKDNAAARTNSKKHSVYPAEVMTQMLVNNPIEEVFPWSTWQSDPDLAIASTISNIGCCLMKLGAVGRIIEITKQIAFPDRFKEIFDFYLHALQIMENEEPSGVIANLAAHPQFFNPVVEQLLGEYLDYFFGAEERDKLRASILFMKKDAVGLDRLFPEIAFNGRPPIGRNMAANRFVSRLIEWGQLTDAREFVLEGQGCFEEPVRSFLAQMISRFQLLGGSSLDYFVSNPLFYTLEAQEVASAIGAASVCKSLAELEDHLATGAELSLANAERFSWSEETFLKEAESRTSQGKEDILRSADLYQETISLLNNEKAMHRSREPSHYTGGKGSFSVVCENRYEGDPPILTIFVHSPGDAQSLRNTIFSVLRCVNKRVEVMIVSDASEAVAEDVIEVMRNGGVSFSVLKGEGEVGREALLNMGAQISRANWFYFIDAGSILLQPFSHLVSALESAVPGDDQINLYYCSRYQQVQRFGLPLSQRFIECAPDVLNNLLTETQQIVAGTFVVRRDLYFAAGGYREDINVFSDYYFIVHSLPYLRAKHLVESWYVERVCLTNGFSRSDLCLRSFAELLLIHAELMSMLGNTSPEQKLQLQTLFRERAYSTLERYIRSGGRVSLARQMVLNWWRGLRENGRDREIGLDRSLISSCCSQLSSLL